MKTPIKILILAVVIIAAVGGVMIYMKTRVSPPEVYKPRANNTKLADSVTAVCVKMTDLNELADGRVSSRDMLALLASEQLLNESDANTRIANIENHYADLIYKFGNDVFNGSVWNQGDLDRIGSLCSSQIRVTDIGGKPVLSSEMNSNLKAHLGVLSDYKAAKAVAASAAFTSVEAAKAKIAEAKKWSEHKVLSNNIRLMSELKAVPKSLGDSHYAYVNRLIDGLSNCSEFSDPVDYANVKYNPVSVAIDKFEDAQSIYGTEHNIQNLRKRAEDLYNDAVDKIFERQNSSQESNVNSDYNGPVSKSIY